MPTPFLRPALAMLVLTAVAPAPGLAGLNREPGPPVGRPDVGGNWGSLGLARDGTLHLLYDRSSPVPYSYALRHAWFDGSEWQDEQVDAALAWSAWRSMIVDPSGRVHVAYDLMVDGRPAEIVRYGVRDATGWSFTDFESARIGSVCGRTGIEPRVTFIGARGQPHVASFDGAEWVVEALPFASPDTDLMSYYAMDGDGHLRAITRRGETWFHEVEAAGGWMESPIPEGISAGGTSLAIDSRGSTHLVRGEYDFGGYGASLMHHRFDGADWTSEFVTSFPSLTVTGSSGLLVDPAGHLFDVISLYDFNLFPWATSSIHLLYRDGSEWRDVPIPMRRPGEITSAVLGPDGAIHAAAISSDEARFEILRITLPDLEVDGRGLTVERRGRGAAVQGTLAVRNRGAGRSRPTKIRFYLSEDDRLDEGDSPVGDAVHLRRVKPGGEAVVPVSLEIHRRVAGQRLLAVADPDRLLEDVDRPNNTAVLVFGE